MGGLYPITAIGRTASFFINGVVDQLRPRPFTVVRSDAPNYFDYLYGNYFDSFRLPSLLLADIICLIYPGSWL